MVKNLSFLILQNLSISCLFISLPANNTKRFTIQAPQSPSKKWEVSVHHVVQVIPGIKSEVNLEGANTK